MDHDLDFRAMTRQRFINRVIDNLENHVMQAGSIISITDVHARTLANRIETFQNLDGG
jgi:hypothetical protein